MQIATTPSGRIVIENAPLTILPELLKKLRLFTWTKIDGHGLVPNRVLNNLQYELNHNMNDTVTITLGNNVSWGSVGYGQTKHDFETELSIDGIWPSVEDVLGSL